MYNRPIKKIGDILKRKSFYLSVVGLIFNFIGSLVLILGAIPSNDQISKMSGTYFGSNKYLAQSLVKNRNLALVGLVILSLGFLLGFLGVVGGRNKK